MRPVAYFALPALAALLLLSLSASALAQYPKPSPKPSSKPDPLPVGKGVDGRPIFKAFQVYVDWCNKNPSKWEYKNRTTCKVYSNAPAAVVKLFKPKTLPKGVQPDKACSGAAIDHIEHKGELLKGMPPPKSVRTPPQKKYVPPKSSGKFGSSWFPTKPSGRRLLQQQAAAGILQGVGRRTAGLDLPTAAKTSYHVIGYHQPDGSAAGVGVGLGAGTGASVPGRRRLAQSSCPGLSCLNPVPALNASFSLPLKLPGGGSLDIGQVFDPSTFLNDFIGRVGKTLCDLSFSGADITSGQWLGKLFGDPSSPIAQAVADLVPLFKSMALRQDINFLIMGFPIGTTPQSAKDGVSASDFDTAKGLLSTGVAIAVNPCTLDIFFEFVGFETPPIPLGDSGLELTLSANAAGFSLNGLIPSDLPGMGLSRSFWTPKGIRNVPTVAPTGHLYFDGGASLAPTTNIDGIVEVSLDGNMKILINTDPMKNNRVGTPSTFADFQILLNAEVMPSIDIAGALNIDLSAFFKGTANLYTGFDSTGFTFAAGVTVERGGPGDLLNQLVSMPPALVSAINTLYPTDNIIDFTGADIYAAADGWGVRFSLGLSKTGILNGLGTALQILNATFGGIPTSIEPTFAILGKTQGNGLPIGIQLGLKGVGQKTLYFCSSSAECPAGSSCQLGLCATTTCSLGTFPTSAITCSLRSCPAGYVTQPLSCLESCKPGEVDQGLTCASCPSTRPQYDAGLCYPLCNPGYYPVGPVCWQYCRSGFIDGGAVCSFNTGTRPRDFGKGCCCTVFGCCGCPAGYIDAGCFCYADWYWKSSYGRGAGVTPSVRRKNVITRIVIPTVTLPD